MSHRPCYKENSLKDFAEWAKECGHFSVAPLIKNYQEFLSYVTETAREDPCPDAGSNSADS